jgi:hypothetical protein
MIVPRERETTEAKLPSIPAKAIAIADLVGLERFFLHG